MMATARYFALYLEKRRDLVSVYRAVRDRGLAQLEGDASQHTVRLVGVMLEQPIVGIDRDFEAWLGGAPQSASGRAPVVCGSELHVVITNVNVRNGPGLGYERLMTLPARSRVAVLAREGQWCQITLTDSTTAYVRADYLAAIEVVEKTLPNGSPSR